MKYVIYGFFLLSATCFCDILSTNGKIQFDAQADGQAEMTLNSTGLGIGILPSANLHLDGNAMVSEQLFVGGSSGSSNLNVNGTIGFGFQTVSENVTLSDYSVVLVDSFSDNIAVTLPYAGNVNGRVYVIKKTSSLNSVLVSGAGNLMDESSYYILNSGNTAFIEVVSQSGQWLVLSLSQNGATRAWTPSDITSAAWFDADDESTIMAGGTGNVYQWNDKSGNNRYALQNTGTNQPTYNATGMNGKPTLQTDGGDRLQIQNRTGLLQNVDGGMIVAVVKYVSGTYASNDMTVFISGGSSTGETRLGMTPNPGNVNILAGAGRRIDANGYQSFNSSTTRTSVYGSAIIEIVNADYAGAKGHHYTNGTQDATDVAFQTAGSTSDTTPLEAMIFGTSALSLPSGCQISEILVINSTLSTDDRQKLEGYLAWKWGLQANLANGHPYKNVAP